MKQKTRVILRSGIIIFLVVIAVGFNVGLADQFSEANKDKPNSSSRLEILLKAWDKANQNARELHYTIQFTTDETDPNQRMNQLLKSYDRFGDDRELKDKTIRKGEGFFKKPKLGRVDWKDEQGNFSESYIWNDKVYEQYDFEKKEKRTVQVPGDNARENLNWIEGFWLHILEERIKWIFFDLPAAELKARFGITLSKEDTNWAYLQLKPLKPDDKANFRALRIVLNQKTHLLRQICLDDVYGHRTVWDFENIEVNPTPPLTVESIFKGLPRYFKEINISTLFTGSDAKAPDSKSR